jgi:hypothetical protein
MASPFNYPKKVQSKEFFLLLHLCQSFQHFSQNLMLNVVVVDIAQIQVYFIDNKKKKKDV